MPEARTTPPDCCCVAPSPTDHIPTSNHALEIIVPPVVPAIVSSSSRNIIVVLRIINELLSVAKNSESYSFTFSIHQYCTTMQILFKLIRRFDHFSRISFLLCLPHNANIYIYIFTESSNISGIDARTDGQRLRSLMNEYCIEVRGRVE